MEKYLEQTPMHIVTKTFVGAVLLATIGGCATTSTEMANETASDTSLLANSSYVTDSTNKVVLSSEDCVRTISWDSESRVVECNSSAKVADKAPVKMTEVGETMVSFNGRALFGFDSASLSSDGQAQLDILTAKLNNQSSIKQIEIVGHTDSIGSEDYNQSLSEQRAETVKRYLQQSLQTVAVSAKGMGESSPVASNVTDDGRSLNRRVDVNVAASIAQ